MILEIALKSKKKKPVVDSDQKKEKKGDAHKSKQPSRIMTPKMGIINSPMRKKTKIGDKRVKFGTI